MDPVTIVLVLTVALGVMKIAYWGIRIYQLCNKPAVKG